MSDPIEVIEEGDHRIKIYYDEDGESPREWDNLGTMVCFHRRYRLGDKTDFKYPEDITEFLRENSGKVISYPLYLYDHSGITISIEPFSCPWDSGQVGYIYVEKEKVLKEFKKKKLSKKLVKKIEELLQSEVETYDKFIRGEVYGYEVYKLDKCKECDQISEEFVDSCWGFYEKEECISNAKEIIKHKTLTKC